jgi:hypothetical protein
MAMDAQRLDLALDMWHQTLPEDWRFSAQFDSPIPCSKATPLDDCFIHIYPTHSHAAIWTRYRAARLIVNGIRLRSLSFYHCQAQRALIDSHRKECQDNIARLAGELYRGILPFFDRKRQIWPQSGRETEVRRVDNETCPEREILPKIATFLAWPLTVAVSAEGVPSPQRERLVYSLSLTAKSLGDAVLESMSEQGVFKF